MVPKTMENALAAVAGSTPSHHFRFPAAKTFRCLDSLSTALTMFDVVLSSSKRVDPPYFLLFFPSFFFFFIYIMPREVKVEGQKIIKCGVSSELKKRETRFNFLVVPSFSSYRSGFLGYAFLH